MAFKYEQRRLSTVDADRGFVMRTSPTFYDSAYPFYLRLEDTRNHLDFDFPVYVKNEVVIVQAKAGPVPQPMDVAATMVKQDAEKLYNTMAAAYRDRSLAFLGKDEFFSFLEQGLVELMTQGGTRLKYVPNYQVGFVDKRPS